jgi:hypothetical protein
VKTFLRKVKLSFLAMLCGWAACNIVWWVGAIPSMDAKAIQHADLRQTTIFVSMVAIYTAIVIAMAWLVIFLPVDLCVSNDSRLRRPKTAALCGFLVAFLIVASVYISAVVNNLERLGTVSGFMATLSLAALPYVLGTCMTGAVAGYIRARMDKPPTRALL